MTASVHTLQLTTAKRAPTMALFFKIDDMPGFGCSLCEGEASLKEAVHAALFGTSKSDAMTVGEVAGAVAALNEDGRIEFEDGWLVLRKGLSDTVEFLMAQVTDARKDEEFTDRERYQQMKRAEVAEEKYGRLQATLLQMIDDVGAFRAAVASGA